MAIVVIILSGVLGIVASIAALVFADVTWFQALMIYLVACITPAALVMAGAYVHTLIVRSINVPDTMPGVIARSQSTR
ncbi:hypothetical protein [Aquicoccus sp.]|uniref:hypothetical protein n=1 Tax=Aquicoccus sp. TaxID=2055851 RepID=UPI0035639F80